MKPPKARGPRSPEYVRLAGIFPLEPIRDEAHFDDAYAMLLHVAALGDSDPGAFDYGEVLTDLVSRFEDVREDPPGAPGACLRAALRRFGMSLADLGAAVGVATAALDACLRGEGGLDADQAVRIGRRLTVNPDQFRDRGPARKRAPSAKKGGAA